MTHDRYWNTLSWGEGPVLTEWFLEPTCPNCARAFSKFGALLDLAGRDRLTVSIVVHSQPWHLFSSVVSRAVLAATFLPDGPDKAWKVLGAVFEHREDYIATDHSHGPNMRLSPSDILERIAEHADVDVSETFERKEVMDLFKKHTRYARQNGIHVSPTVMLNGLVDDGIGSRDDVGTLITKLGLG